MRNKTTKRNYTRAYPWPVSELLFWKQRQTIRSEVLYGKAGVSQLVFDALESLRTLSELLASSDYFAGSRPGYIDALAYGLLASAIVLLPPSHQLRTMIETCSNLRALIGRLRRSYFDNSDQ